MLKDGNLYAQNHTSFSYTQDLATCEKCRFGIFNLTFGMPCHGAGLILAKDVFPPVAQRRRAKHINNKNGLST